MCGQWRVDSGARYALDYSTLFTRMERLRLDDEAWETLFADIRVIEASALEQMAEDMELQRHDRGSRR